MWGNKDDGGGPLWVALGLTGEKTDRIQNEWIQIAGS